MPYAFTVALVSSLFDIQKCYTCVHIFVAFTYNVLLTMATSLYLKDLSVCLNCRYSSLQMKIEIIEFLKPTSHNKKIRYLLIFRSVYE